MKAIITVGISASGKSTFANKWVKDAPRRTNINRDDIRVFIVEVEKRDYPFTWAKWNWKWEKDVTARATKELGLAAKHGYDVIFSDTNLNAKYRNMLILDLQSLGYEIEMMEFPVDIETAWARDAARLNGVGHSVIAKQHEAWLAYISHRVHYTNTDNPIDFPRNSFRKYIPDTNKPAAVIVDIDGTLANMDGKRNPYDWHKVHLDTVHEHVKLIVNSLIGKVEIIILSGRNDVCKDATRAWLYDNGIMFDRLHMRKDGDVRDDASMKADIFWDHIDGNFNVIAAIDDRPSMVRYWRTLGIPTLACGNQYIEF